MPPNKDRSSGFPSDLPAGSVAPPVHTPAARDEGSHPFAAEDHARYVEARPLAEGGMGVVEEVTDQRLGRQVALKRCLARDASSAARFAREAWITAQLDHPGIVPVHDAGIGPDGELHYVMRLVRGTTLRQALDEPPGDPAWQRGDLDLLRHLRDAAEAVGYAHRGGIVHRDLKPSNIMVGPFGETQVMDWGLARPVPGPRGDGWRSHLSDEFDVATVQGSVLGTPQYMSPEQAHGRPLGPQADVWSLGVMLFEIVSGTKPFPGDQLPEVVAQITAGAPAVERLSARDVPAPLRAVIARALAAEPSDRYPDAKALADDLNRWLAGHRVEAHVYGTGELIGSFVQRFRIPIGITLTLLTVLIISLSILTVQARREAERANAAEAAAQHVQGRLLVQQALGAQSVGDRARAEVLAAAALVRAEDPDARGVLAANAVIPRPERVFAAQGPSCEERVMSPRGAYFVCVRDDAFALWSTRPLARQWALDAVPQTQISVDDAGYVLAVQHWDSVQGSHLYDANGSIMRSFNRGRGFGVPPFTPSDEIYTVNRALLKLSAAEIPEFMHPCAESGTRGPQAVMLACSGTIVAWSPSGVVERPTAVGTSDLGFANRMVASDDAVFLGTEVGWIVAHAWPGGEELWRTDLDHAIVDLSVSVDGDRLAVLTGSGVPILLDARTGAEQVRLPAVSAGAGIAFDPQGHLWVAGAEITAYNAPPPPSRDLGHGLTGLAFNPAGTELAATHSTGFTVLAWPSLKRVRVASVGPVVAKDVAATPAGFRVSVGGRHGPGVLLDENGVPLGGDKGLALRRVARYGDDHILVVTVVTGEVFRFRLEAGAQAERMSTQTLMHDIDATPDGRHVAFADSDGAGLFHYPSAVPERIIAGAGIRTADVSSEGSTLVVGTRGAVWAVDVETGEEVWRLNAEGLLPRQLRISPEDRWVAVGDDVGMVHLIDMRGGGIVARLHGHTEQVPALTFTADGQRLVSGSWDDHLAIWDLGVLDAAPADLVSDIETAWGLTEAELLGSP